MHRFPVSSDPVCWSLAAVSTSPPSTAFSQPSQNFAAAPRLPLPPPRGPQGLFNINLNNKELIVRVLKQEWGCVARSRPSESHPAAIRTLGNNARIGDRIFRLPLATPVPFSPFTNSPQGNLQICGVTVGELKTVSDMHKRKAEMAHQADAFIALPGGYGTLEELLEIISWAQLGIHAKPV